jgi:DNA-directed RNA polymerase specialized sigma24 family protein
VRPADYIPDQGARFEVHLTKARGVHGADAEPYEAWLQSDADGRQQWTFRNVGAIKVEQARAMKREGLTIRDIAAELGVSKSTAQRWIARPQE